jgi:AsmA-like C-terminal region
MSPLRILIASLCLVIIVAGGTAAIALHNQARLIQLVLARIHAETGYNIIPTGARLIFRNHLVVLLEKPTIYFNGIEVARVDALRAVIRYHTILSTNGLPLYKLALDHPQVRAPANLEGLTPHGFPKPDITVVTKLKWALDSISDVAQRIEIVNAALKDVDGTPLVDHLTLTAYRQHRDSAGSPWMMIFDATWNHAPFDGAAVAGKYRLGTAPGDTSNLVASGSMSFHGFQLEPFKGPSGIEVAGRVSGTLKFAMRHDGEVLGAADTSVTRLVVKGKPFTAPLALGDVLLHAVYNVSIARLELKEFAVMRNGATLLTGGGAIGQPYEDTRAVAIHMEGVRVALTQAAAWMRLLRFVPAPVNDFARRFISGQVALSEASFNPSAAVKDWSARTLRENLTVRGNVTGVGFDALANLKLPPIRRVEAAIVYAGGLLTLRQGSASIGKSTLTGVAAEVNVKRAPALISYKLRAKGVFDAGELHPALNGVIAAVEPDLAQRIAVVSGTSAIEMDGAGKIAGMKWSAPTDYTLKVSPRRVELAIKGAPGTIAINGGTVQLQPGVVQINQLIGGLTTPHDGSATLDGTIIAGPNPVFRNCVVEFREFHAETWLPLMLDPHEASAQGPVSGRLTAQSDARHVAVPLITGRLAIGPGELRFGFLRSPIVVQTMTVALDGQGMKVAAPGAELEGSPVNLTITMAQFANPLLHLDANASTLDLEVMNFIRMPWSPKTPTETFNLPIEGHIAAGRGRFGKLQLGNLNTDFDRMNGHWHVHNFTARSLEGQVKLDLSGRSDPDNHIRIKAFIDNIDAKALCILMGQTRPALIGRLSATGDLWGDTDVDFFASLTGKLSISAVKGTLDRFALVTRVLSFIDLKNWLTAHLPDPRVDGIPFDTLSATLSGTNGNFHTSDLHLSGPVMEIAARGSVRVSDNTIDMVISLFPFDTANWLVRHIPLIGKHLAGGSYGLVAAYFHVSGPIDNPSVVPKPITSVAEFVAKTLSLPINIIAPNTIKP